MGNEVLFDGERGSIRWGTRFYSMGNEVLFDGNEVVRVYAVTCTETWSTPSSISVTGMGFILS